MRKTNSSFTLLVLILLTFTLFASPLKSSDDNCFSIVVGKDAAVDGHVIMAHNEDDSPPQVVNHSKVPRLVHAAGTMITLNNGGQLPQVDTTYAYFWSEIPGFLFSDSYMNEFGVTVCSDACPSREDRPELTDGGINYNLRKLIAQRARTAREGVLLAGELIKRFGYDASGRTLIICDPNEGWLLAMVNGKNWVAARVPDDEVALIANSYTIHGVDLSDTVNFLGAPDIEIYAKSRQWDHPHAEEAFNFSISYADPGSATHPTNIGRQWAAINMIAADSFRYEDDLPFSVKPKEKLSIQSVMAILRDHYEGTDLAAVAETGNPHDRNFLPICRHDTQTSFVAQLRNDLPGDLGLVYWCALGSPCASIYVPFYFGIDQFPAAYQSETILAGWEDWNEMIKQPLSTGLDHAFWTFSRMRDRTEAGYRELAPQLRSHLETLEQRAFDQQPAIDRTAGEMLKVDRAAMAAMLEKFSFDIYHKATSAAQSILGD